MKMYESCSLCGGNQWYIVKAEQPQLTLLKETLFQEVTKMYMINDVHKGFLC